MVMVAHFDAHQECSLRLTFDPLADSLWVHFGDRVRETRLKNQPWVSDDFAGRGFHKAAMHGEWNASLLTLS